MSEVRDDMGDLTATVDAAIARTTSWLATLGIGVSASDGADVAEQARPDLLDGARYDADGFTFTRRLLDAVASGSDPFAAALELREVARDLPANMPALERLAVRAGGFASLGMPWAVLPVARKWLRERVSHLVLSTKIPTATDDLDTQQQHTKIEALRAAVRSAQRQPGPAASGTHRGNTHRSGADRSGSHPNDTHPARVQTTLALTGIDVVGDTAARLELDRLLTLVALPEVTHVSVNVARLVPRGLAGEWSLDHDAKRGAEALRELLIAAHEHHTAITLESSDYRSSLLAPQMLVHALQTRHEPALTQVRVGVSLPAELPESLQTAHALVQLSRARVSLGASALEVTVQIAGYAGHEQIHSILSGLPVAPFDSRVAHTAQWIRLVTVLLEHHDVVRTVAATDDACLLAFATQHAERLGARDRLSLQLRAGAAPALETVIREHGFCVRRRLPLAVPKEIAGIVEYLIALAAETADAQSVLAHTRALLSGDSAALEQGAARLREALTLASHAPPSSHRVQQRAREWSEDARDTSAFYRDPTEMHRPETGGLTAAVLGLTRSHTGAITLELAGPLHRVPVISATGFANEPRTDASNFENRSWVRHLLNEASRSELGLAAVARARVDAQQLDAVIVHAREASETWRDVRAAERGRQAARLALATAAGRDQLVSVLAAESGQPASVLDAEISGAIDAARYLGQLANGLGAVRGAAFVPDRVALVVAGAGVPLDERSEAVLASIAAGSAVIVAAHPSIARSYGVLFEQWRMSGLADGLVTLLVVDDTAEVARIAADTRLDRVTVLGTRHTAREIVRHRPDQRVTGRFRASGVAIITSTAEPVRAARDAVQSAFGAAHADATLARRLVLLGPAARSQVLRSALADAVASLIPGDSARPRGADPLTFALGPLPEPPSEAGLRALTHLEPGEEWVVRPVPLDDERRLWRPGLRFGVSRDSRFWQDSLGMPVIGVTSAHTMGEAIALANRLGAGGVASLHATDPAEMLPWLERTEAAALSLGRPTTGSRIERQPQGGWREAGMATVALTGGPNRLLTLGSWEPREGTASQTLHLRGLAPEVRVLIETSQASLDYQSFDRLRRASLSDALTWRTALGKVDDVSGLGIERNLLRHWPVSTHVRLSEGEALGDLLRVVSAGLVVGAPMSVSTGSVLPAEISAFLASQGVTVSLERDDAWLERVSVQGPGDDELAANRVRLIGGDRVRAAEWIGGLGEITLWAEPVTMAGPVELLTFLHEQSVSITAHRHGLAFVPAGIGTWLSEIQN